MAGMVETERHPVQLVIVPLAHARRMPGHPWLGHQQQVYRSSSRLRRATPLSPSACLGVQNIVVSISKAKLALVTVFTNDHHCCVKDSVGDIDITGHRVVQ